MPPREQPARLYSAVNAQLAIARAQVRCRSLVLLTVLTRLVSIFEQPARLCSAVNAQLAIAPAQVRCHSVVMLRGTNENSS